MQIVSSYLTDNDSLRVKLVSGNVLEISICENGNQASLYDKYGIRIWSGWYDKMPMIWTVFGALAETRYLNI